MFSLAEIIMHKGCWDLATQNHNCILETYFSFWLWLACSYGLQIANLLNCTSWSGVGPGLMHAATKGALQVAKPAGGLKIGKEAVEGTASNFHLSTFRNLSYLQIIYCCHLMLLSCMNCFSVLPVFSVR